MADSSLLVLLAPNESEAAAFLPGKLFEYLAARRPILCIAAPDNGIRQIIADSRAGQSFDYAQETAMLQFLEQQKSAWENGNTARLTESGYLKYSRRNLTAVLAKLLNNL
ncbi:MAG: hypothetical protein LBN27_03100, partial [Prevotellaceae bacterium]|jgi:glycosyltransferase involved in cell wall biosynthesis|nr:hypothetical protein [Prevotellaceae bacterium]